MPTIRIPQSPVGGGPSPVIPSGGLAAAEAQAQQANVLAGGLGQLGQEVKRLGVRNVIATEQQRREDERTQRELEKQQAKVDAKTRLVDQAELRVHRQQLDEDIAITLEELLNPAEDSPHFEALPSFETVQGAVGGLIDDRLEMIRSSVESEDLLEAAEAEFGLRRADSPALQLAHARSKERFLDRQRARSNEQVINMNAPVVDNRTATFGVKSAIDRDLLSLGIATLRANNAGEADNGGNSIAQYLENMRLGYADDFGQTLEFALYTWNSVDEWMANTPDAAASRKLGKFKEWARTEFKARVDTLLKGPTPNLKGTGQNQLDVMQLMRDPDGEVAQFIDRSTAIRLTVAAGAEIGLITPEEAGAIDQKVREQLGVIGTTQASVTRMLGVFGDSSTKLDLSPALSDAADLTWPLVLPELQRGSVDERVSRINQMLDSFKGNAFPELAGYIQGLDMGNLEDRTVLGLIMRPYDMVHRDDPQSFEPGQRGWRSSGPVLTDEQRWIAGFMGQLLAGEMDPAQASALVDTELEAKRKNSGDPVYAKIVNDSLAEDDTNILSTERLRGAAQGRLGVPVEVGRTGHSHYLATVQRVSVAWYRSGISKEAARAAGFAFADETHKRVGNHFEYLPPELRFPPEMVTADLVADMTELKDQFGGQVPTREEMRLTPIPDLDNPAVPRGYLVHVERDGISILATARDGTSYVYEPSEETSVLSKRRRLIEAVIGGDQIVGEEEFEAFVQDPELSKRMSATALALDVAGNGAFAAGFRKEKRILSSDLFTKRQVRNIPDIDFVANMVPDSMIDPLEGVMRHENIRSIGTSPVTRLLTRDEIALRLAADDPAGVLERAGFERGTGLYRFDPDGIAAYQRGHGSMLARSGSQAQAQTEGRNEVMRWMTGSVTWQDPDTWAPGIPGKRPSVVEKVRALRIARAMHQVRLITESEGTGVGLSELLEVDAINLLERAQAGDPGALLELRDRFTGGGQ